jgi:hypothetical protein
VRITPLILGIATLSGCAPRALPMASLSGEPAKVAVEDSAYPDETSARELAEVYPLTRPYTPRRVGASKHVLVQRGAPAPVPHPEVTGAVTTQPAEPSTDDGARSASLIEMEKRFDTSDAVAQRALSGLCRGC